MYRELASVVAEADADPCFVLLEVVHAIGRGPSLLRIDKVVNIHVSTNTPALAWR